MGEITAPIIAITLVLLSVFVPVAFIPGISGELFRQFAVAVSVSMVISAINALTLSPALCAVFLRGAATGRSAGRSAMCSRGIDKARDGYALVVRKLVRARGVRPRCCWLVVIGGAGWLFKVTPTGFLPSEDQGAFFGEVQLPEGASVNRTDAVAKRVEEIVRNTPGVAGVTSVVGYSLLDGLAQVEQRAPDRDAEAVRGAQGRRRCRRNGIIAQADGASSRPIREAIVFAYNLPPIIGLGTGSGFEYQLLEPARRRRRRDRGGRARPGVRRQPGPGAAAASSPPTAPTRRSSISTSTARRCRRSASTCPTSSTRCSRCSAAPTSTTSTCSAAPGRSTSRARPPTAPRSTTSTASTSATATARWCRSAPSPRRGSSSGRSRSSATTTSAA